MPNASNVIDNTAESRFELSVEGEIAYADYHVTGDTLYIDYVFAPDALRGTGAAGKLMQGLVDTVSDRPQKIVPICGYAVAWLKRHRL
ncbi:GNAT family N-acetyltransferase [Asticcacaulis sp. ZE23SCel15]|uniref:GNAT family N-acetyltransferase n=1 Tax=Asticcacaulis sp. ZE23SCel15 TaxID=3059027 RepID=UPI00265FBCEA|nr:GNAT family N-acetyltransferase [Asticcacaulis sp. ZE23SCel15]WKL56920.1 GNAT family N-acetyltransferase [Asticcacaulis sp. ZE23SCel15]